VITQLIDKLGFGKTYYIEGRASIADLVKPGKRCGIYLLHFSDGQYYVGQAIDVTRRYVQHRKHHVDIQQLSFMPVRRAALDESERVAIGMLESEGARLRNITFMSMPLGDSDFDLIMPDAQQKRWLTDLSFVDSEGSRPVHPELRQRYSRKFMQFQQQKFAQPAIQVLRSYIQKCTPAIRRGEISFWSCSCLPSYRGGGSHVYTRVNVFWQEVLTIYSTSDLLFTWQVAKSPLEQAYGKSLFWLRLQFPTLFIDPHRQYKTGGADQIRLGIRGADAALHLLDNQYVVKAARLMNLRLMRKGACTFNRYHCLDLADQIIV